MKILPMFVVLSIFSLLVMIGIDVLLSSRAEFLNAWSVVERLVGREATAGQSFVHRSLGAVGELVCVVTVNLIIGGLLTVLVRVFIGK